MAEEGLNNKGVRYSMNYAGSHTPLMNRKTYVMVCEIKGQAKFGVSCPFCGSGMLKNSRQDSEDLYKCMDGHRIRFISTEGDKVGWR